MKAIVLHVEDIALKKGNRPYFFRQLMASIRPRLSDIGDFRVFVKDNRVFVVTDDDRSLERAFRLAPCFMGVALARKSTAVQPDIGAIAGAALALAEQSAFASFKVETRRSSKKHPFTSPEVNQAVGAAIQAKTSARVDLTKPERTFWVDVLQDEALVASEQVKGFGGLPVGSSGRALCLFSGGIDSPVAAFLAMQRGLKVDLVHFSAFPYVRFVNEEKQRLLVERLALFQGATRIYRVGIGEVQQRLAAHVPKRLLVVFTRRTMLRIAGTLAQRFGYGALLTGESLGQVASQTLENLKAIDQASPMLTLRPLIGLGKQAIVGIARQIGTFSISIQQDEDCCQLFLPRHPETRAGLEEVLAVESGLPIRAWEEEALEALEFSDGLPALQGELLEGSGGTFINEDRPLVYGSVS